MDKRVPKLKHVTRELPNGGFVLVLNTGAVIDAEGVAMLQALHSRSLGGIRAHLQRLAEVGPAKFMSTFYVGYGHKSIGDCGDTTVFIEGVSMLVAKAIQDWMLYTGQESSTRYMDFANQPFVDPFGSARSRKILERWRSFYLDNLEPVRAFLREQFPRAEKEDAEIYEKAIKARCFDILRGFLPAGAGTNLSWHTNLRQAADKLSLLRHHPLPEVQIVAEALESALKEAHPNSFSEKRYEATESYNARWMQEKYLYRPDVVKHHQYIADEAFLAVHAELMVDVEVLEEYRELIASRPQWTELPKQIGECGSIRFTHGIDFASFRDEQRQRSVYQRMGMITDECGFHPWYLKSLPEYVSAEAGTLIALQLAQIRRLPVSDHMRQYYMPMGMCVPCRMTGDLAAVTYVAELRAQTTVHPTLQAVAVQMADILTRKFSVYGLRLYINRDVGRFDVKRGKHDIVQKV